jgi:hypothetical protein
MVARLDQVIGHAEQLKLARGVAFTPDSRHAPAATAQQFHDATSRGGDRTLLAFFPRPFFKKVTDSYAEGFSNAAQRLGTGFQSAILDAGKVGTGQAATLTQLALAQALLISNL